MTLGEIFTALRARWRTSLFVLLVVVASVGAVNFLRAPQYTATAAVLLDVKSPDPIAGVVLPGMTVVGYMATQLNVIQSERVARGAIRELHLDGNADYQSRWRSDTGGAGDFQSWLSDVFLRKIGVVPARDSNVITISYTSPDPDFSAAVANAWIKSYIDTTLDLRVEPAKQYNGFFDARSKEVREELEQAQAKLSAYQQKKGIVATDEKLDVENSRLAELSTQLVMLQGVANESGGRQNQAATNPRSMQEVLSNPVIIAMTTELAKLEAQLNEMGARLGNNHPDMVELRAKIVQLRSSIDVETKRVTGSLTVNNDVNQTRLAQLRLAVSEQRAKLLQIKGQRDEAAVLQRDVENAQRAYDTIQTRTSQASLESQTTQTNVSVLKQATSPSTPSSPRVVLNLAVAVLIGGLMGIGVALIRELRDRRLRSDFDVAQILRQPLLGVLPAKARSKRISPSRLRLTTNPDGPRAS